jgi:hypothetical protein
MKKKQIVTIKIFNFAGNFAENKDKAMAVRKTSILPALKAGKDVILDYNKVDDTTQSFTHALISEGIRIYRQEFFSRVFFKHCSKSVKKVIGIVSDYMQRNQV